MGSASASRMSSSKRQKSTPGTPSGAPSSFKKSVHCDLFFFLCGGVEWQSSRERHVDTQRKDRVRFCALKTPGIKQSRRGVYRKCRRRGLEDVGSPGGSKHGADVVLQPPAVGRCLGHLLAQHNVHVHLVGRRRLPGRRRGRMGHLPFAGFVVCYFACAWAARHLLEGSAFGFGACFQSLAHHTVPRWVKASVRGVRATQAESRFSNPEQ